MRKASIGLAVLVTAAAGIAALTGSALAGVGNDFAGGGNGGAATNNCANVGVIPIAAGVLGQAGSNNQGCLAGAAGGAASNY